MQNRKYAGARVFEDPTFVTMERQTLCEILDQDVLNVNSEVEIYEAVIKWAENQCRIQDLEINSENERKVLGEEMIGKIRFLALTVEEFSEYIAGSILLTTDEKLMLYNCISCPKKYKLEGFFSNNTNKRMMFPNTYFRRQRKAPKELDPKYLADSPSSTSDKLKFSVKVGGCVISGLIILTYSKEVRSAPLNLQANKIKVTFSHIERKSTEYYDDYDTFIKISDCELEITSRNWWGDIFVGLPNLSGYGLTIVSFPSHINLELKKNYVLSVENDKKMYQSWYSFDKGTPLTVLDSYTGCIAGLVFSEYNYRKRANDGYVLLHPDIPIMSFYEELANFLKK